LVEEGVAFEMALAAIMRRVQSHLLVHAGVVARDGKAYLFSADSFHGKTTLVLKLLQQGFAFLSDDIAALSRADRLVYPFPRSLRLRPGTLELLGYDNALWTDAQVWHGKLLLDAEQLVPGCMGQPAPIAGLILLTDDNAGEHGHAQADAYDIELVIDRLDPEFVAAMQAMPGLLSIEKRERSGHPSLVLCVAGKADAVAHIHHWSQQRRVFIINLLVDLPEQPDFGRTPHLTPIAKSDALRHLLKQFKGSHQSRLLTEAYAGKSTRLYLDLAGMIKQAQCYRLTVGRLDEMAGLIDDLAI
jgi:hypothetical protein